MEVKTFAEKRFFHWVEDYVSVNIRAKSGSYGGAARFLSLRRDKKTVMRETIGEVFLIWNGKCDSAQGGGVAFSITGDHDNRPTDMTNIAMISERREKMSNKTIVRRLTPTECERLQGFPDGWTDIGEYTDTKGKKRTTCDSNRYKELGNSIAIPQWYWIFKKMEKHLPKHERLGSLFDGIVGFPLAWEDIHGEGTARWASEIEEFPIAVTKFHFGED